jgi:hypothetical protein
MESGYREVLALVHSMRENQEVLMQSFQKLPEAVDSVKKLADHSAQQSELLTAMNEQMQAGSPGKFNETLTSMDKTTQLLLERAQRTEERLYSMLRRAQRRIAFMTLLVLLLFLGTGATILFLAFPTETRNWLEERGWRSTDSGETSQLPDDLDTVMDNGAVPADAAEPSPVESSDSDAISGEEPVEPAVDDAVPEAEVEVPDPLPIPPPPPVDVPEDDETDTGDDAES